MLKRTRSLLVLSLAVAVIAPILLSAPNTVEAQHRRILVEEFTGAWCGWCPRGALAIQQLKQEYPGQVFGVSYHSDANGNPVNDMMDVKQGDTLMAGISTITPSTATAVQSFPTGWTARTAENGSWDVDPGSWIDTIGQTGLVEQMLGQTASVNVSVDQISYNATTKMVSARVNAKFNSAMSGDLRFNLLVIEDSVTGTGAGYDQHNYYYHNASFPTSPFYNVGMGAAGSGTIPGFYHMQVFRYSPGPIWGTDGIIPATVASGGSYSETYTFPLPSNVKDPNHVQLIGFVSQYSTTDISGNQILDADQEPLVGAAPKYLFTSILMSADNQYSIAKSNSTTPENITVTNNGSSPVTLSLAAAGTLPSGWSASVSPSTLPLDAGASKSVTLNVTASDQSAYVTAAVTASPIQEGYVVAKYQTSVNLLSDNTTYAAYSSQGESASIAGMPDSMRLHTAYMPLNSDILANYDPSSSGLPIKLAMFLNDACLDGSETVTGMPSIMATIANAMAAGQKVYISSNDAMAFAFAGNATTETDAVTSFFLDSLGITWKLDKSRVNSNGQAVPFRIDGTTDPIGAGMTNLGANSTGSISGDPETPLFSFPTTGSPSTSLFYVDNTPASNVSLKTALPSGNRVVYMGFGLDALTNQVKADTIFRRSIEWLMSAAPSAVNAPPAVASAGISASPNPFHGMTQIQYVAGANEHGVSLAAYDVMGREVATLSTQNIGGSVYTAFFDGSKLTNGTYTIIAHSSTGTHEVRVVNQQ